MTSETPDSYYRLLCEHLGMAVISTDAELNIVTWNTAAARTFGAARARMIGTPITQIIPQERRRIAERMLRRAIETGETIEFEFAHRDARGERQELAGTIAPVLSNSASTTPDAAPEDARRVGASICIRDITRRISLEDELHENHKMVALGEMAGAIAHHFNNILGGAVTSIDYADASDDALVQGRVLRQVGRALQRATVLVNGLLAFAEGDRRADDVSELEVIARELAEKTQRSLEGRPIEFDLKIATLPSFPVPRIQTATIIGNLLQNSIEAMPDGGSLQLDVSLIAGSAVILVIDTGCGLDESTKSRIFEPFWSTKGELGSETEKGTGLGLAIAHGLVHMMNGTISVTSERGKGCCFRVTLPRQAAE